jgi:hypothetical protein
MPQKLNCFKFNFSKSNREHKTQKFKSQIKMRLGGYTTDETRRKNYADRAEENARWYADPNNYIQLPGNPWEPIPPSPGGTGWRTSSISPRSSVSNPLISTVPSPTYNSPTSPRGSSYVVNPSLSYPNNYGDIAGLISLYNGLPAGSQQRFEDWLVANSTNIPLKQVNGNDIDRSYLVQQSQSVKTWSPSESPLRVSEGYQMSPSYQPLSVPTSPVLTPQSLSVQLSPRRSYVQPASLSSPRSVSLSPRGGGLSPLPTNSKTSSGLSPLGSPSGLANL